MSSARRRPRRRGAVATRREREGRLSSLRGRVGLGRRLGEPVPCSPGRLASRLAFSLVAVTGALAVVAAGCSRDGFEDRTAVVDVGDRAVEFALDSCGIDGDTLFLVGRGRGGEVLQAVVGIGDDGTSGDPAATGATFEVGATSYAAFGPVSWELRDGPGPVPGRIAWARLRGARIQLAGEAEPVDPGGRRTADPGAPVAFELDARCDEQRER